MQTVASSFDVEEFGATITPRKKDKPEPSACVYFGQKRLADIRKKLASLSAKSGQDVNFSEYVCAAVDTNLELDPAKLDRLEGLARLRGISLPELFRRIVDDALNRASAC